MHAKNSRSGVKMNHATINAVRATTLLAGMAMAPFSVVAANVPHITLTRVESDELSARFFAAVRRSGDPLTDVMEWQRLVALKYIERDTGLALGADRAIEDSAAKTAELKLAFRLVTPKGLRRLYPKIGELTFENAANTFNMPEMRDSKKFGMFGFWMMASSIADECRPGEPVYNRKFVKHVAKQPWQGPRSEVFQYSIYFRLFDHDCLSEAELRKATEPLMPAIRRMIEPRALAPADFAGLMFMLTASKRTELIARETLLRFARMQRPDGTWANDAHGEYASMNAAMGAFVLANTLKSNQVAFTNADLEKARAAKPKLPASTFVPPRPR